MIKEEIKHILETTIETMGGYPVKALVYNGGTRNYISGLVQDPIKGNPLAHDGFRGCAWYSDGVAMPKNTKFGVKKPRPDLKLKIIEKNIE